ncbi:MAG TPA: methyltransferase [Anaerolineales bacterium]|nr:methyltransferase [Anaerolineales bacterium]
MWIYLAAGFWALLAGAQLRSAITNYSVLPLLLAFENGLIGWRLLGRRHDAAAPQPGWVNLVAWGSVFLPLAIRIEGQTPLIASVVAGAGVALTIWAILSLGPAFGIAPADRGLVTKGPYRLIRHPMYTGALINLLAAVGWNLGWWNIGILVLVIASIVFRVYHEEKVIAGYSEYVVGVRWRVIPFVW